jgi:hypothetical protein
LPVEELAPFGHLYEPQITKALIERCGFLSYPQKVEDYLDSSKGLEFGMGKWDDLVISKLTIYPGGLAIDTNSSTRDSERILDEMLLWAKETLGIKYESSMFEGKGYLSQLTFKSNRSLNLLNPKLGHFAKTLTKSVSDEIKFTFQYETTAIILGFDTTHVKPNAATFTVERKIDTPFSENKFFSSAPVSTELHLHLLEEFETALTT